MAIELKVFYNTQTDWTLPVLVADGTPWFVMRYVCLAIHDARPITVVKEIAGGENYRVFPHACFTDLEDAPKRGYACVNRKGLSRYLKSVRERYGTAVCEWVKSDILPLLDGNIDAPTPQPTLQPAAEQKVAGADTFYNNQFGTLTVITRDGDPWFIGKEVAEKLGYSDTKDAVKRHVDEEDKTILQKGCFPSLANIPNRGIYIINESGLYSLIMSSKLPLAKNFKRWVTSEVLPSIRRHGAYMNADTLEQVMNDPDAWIRLLQGLKDEREKNRKLAATNAALVREENTWEPIRVLNALVRSYAMRCKNGVYGYAWSDLYKRLDYRYGINVKIRAGMDKKKKMMVSYLNPDELKLAVSVAVAMCEEHGCDVGAIINETNAAAYAAA